MLKPPPLPKSALLGGKIAVGITWLFGLFAVFTASADSTLHTVGSYLLIFLLGSHLVELVIYSAFMKAAKATPADYSQVLLFGIFHSGGMKAQE